MPRLDRHAWIAGAWTMLDARPEVDLSIERLARHLGVTRGSFYHHYAGRQVFVRALLEDWERSYTTEVILGAGQADSARAVLERYLEITATLQPGREIALRRWAASERAVADAVQRVDAARMGFVGALTQRLFPNASLAAVERSARVGFLAFVGMQQTARHRTGALRELVDDWLFMAAAACCNQGGSATRQ